MLLRILNYLIGGFAVSKLQSVQLNVFNYIADLLKASLIKLGKRVFNIWVGSVFLSRRNESV